MKKTLIAILITCFAFSAAAQTFEKLYREEVIGGREHCQGATGFGNVIFQFYDGAPAIDIYDLIEAGIPNEPEGLFIIGDRIYVVDVQKNVYSITL